MERFSKFKIQISEAFERIKRSIGDFFYLLECILCKPFDSFPKRKNPLSQKTKNLIFYCLILTYPLVQFLIFYIGVNFNSLLLTFQMYDRATSHYTFIGFGNIVSAFRSLTQDSTVLTAFGNSFLVWSIALAAIPLNLIFTFYIYKKKPFYSVFKVVLFIPSIISSIAMVIMFMYFVERAVPSFVNGIFSQTIVGLLSNESTVFPTLVFFNVFFGFGPNMLLFLGAMNKIPKEVIEAAHIDGAIGIRELFRIILPNIYGTIATLIVLNVTAIFGEQYALFSFFGNAANPKMITIGYYLFTKTASASLAEYPFLSAVGLLLTCLAIPLTFIVRFTLDKFDPARSRK